MSTLVQPAKSTNVRITPVRERLLRTAFAGLQRVAPPVAGWGAARLFCTPPRPRLTDRAREVLATAEPFALRAMGERVAAWKWGSGPVVYLSHGWGGRGGNLAAAFVEPLTAAGFTVVAFDAPGHGASGGRTSSMLHLAAALRAAVERFGPAHALVAHSLGGTAAAFALQRGVEARRAVLVGPAADPQRYIDGFFRWLGIAPALAARVKEGFERRLGFAWGELAVPGYAPRMRTPLLVVHDRDDAEVPWRDGAAIAAAWPGARLVTTTGLGHRVILRDPGVVRETVEFVAGETSA
jgi:pimeloyl-ACP methyl ester carboxylesterase